MRILIGLSALVCVLSSGSQSQQASVLSMKNKLEPLFKAIADSTDTCDEELPNLAPYLDSISGAKDLSEFLVHLGALSREFTEHCDDNSLVVSAIAVVFEGLSSDEAELIEEVVDDILDEDWSSEWSEEMRACLAELSITVDPHSRIPSLEATIRTVLPVPLLAFLLAAGLFIDARDLSILMTRYIDLPGCLAIKAVEGLERVDFAEPPGAMTSMRRVSESLSFMIGSLRPALDRFLEIPELKKLLGKARQIKPQLYEAASLRNRKVVMASINQLKVSISDSCRSRNGDIGDCLSAGYRALDSLQQAALLIPDRGSAFPNS